MSAANPGALSSAGPPGRRCAARVRIRLFVGTWAVTIVIFCAGWLAVPEALRTRWASESHRVTERNADRYYVELEHYVHLFGVDPLVNQSMRATDVLLTGTSRLMMGLSEREVGEFFGKRSLNYYFLGFGHAEPVVFDEEVIRRQGLHPRWVIANVDGFFRANPSRRGHEVMSGSTLSYWQEDFEVGATLSILPWLHRWYPRVPPDREVAFWRSRTTGAWTPRLAMPEGTPFGAAPRAPADEKIDRDVMEAALRFKQLCDNLGAKLILTYVPSPNPADSREAAEIIAKRLGVPLCAPRVEGMKSFDGSHLVPESARIFTEAFLARLAIDVPEWAEPRSARATP